MSANARRELAAADPAMAALIERIGEIDLADAAAAAQRGAPRRRLRRPAAGDRRPAALDQGGADDLPAGLRAVRRRDALARAAARGRARTTCAAPASPAARSSTCATSPRTCSPASSSWTASASSPTRRSIEEIVAVRGLGPLDRRDVPALPPRTARRALRRRPRHPQGGAGRVRAGRRCRRRSGCWRSASPGGPTAASPRSTSGSRSQRSCRVRRAERLPTIGPCAFASGSDSPSSPRSRSARSLIAAGRPRPAKSTTSTHCSADEAHRSARQAEARGRALGRPAGHRRGLPPGGGKPHPRTSSRCRPLAPAARGAHRGRLHRGGARRPAAALRTQPRLRDLRTRAPGHCAGRRPRGPSTTRSPTRPPSSMPRRRRSATTSAPTPAAAAYLRIARDSRQAGGDPGDAAAARRHRHQRLPARLPRRRPDRDRRPAARGPDRVRRRRLPRLRPRGRRDRPPARRRRRPARSSAAGPWSGLSWPLDEAAAAPITDRRPDLAAGRPRPRAAPGSACRC